MPFLRRRGNMASETDMRRHSLFDSLAVPVPKQSPIRSESSTDLPALTSVAEDGPSPIVPASPADFPRDSISVASTNAVPSVVDASDGPGYPVPDESQKHRRFSMLRFRNASDSQLAAKAKLHAAAEKPPPVPRPPAIITTAPTFAPIAPRKKPSRMNFAARLRRSGELSRAELTEETGNRPAGKAGDRISRVPEENAGSKQSVTFEEPKRPSSSYGDDRSSSLALPPNRLSESSRSDASSGDRAYGSAATAHPATTFFRLPRRKHKQPEPLFPISHLQPRNKNLSTENSAASSSSLVVPASGLPDRSLTPTLSRIPSRNGVATPPPHNQTVTILAKSTASPATALFRPSSRQSGQSSPTRSYAHRRGRSSTMSSLGRNSPRESVDEHLAPPTSRTSLSIGRKSFGDLLGLSRLRQNSDMLPNRQGSLTPATPGSNTSKNNSLQLPRDSINLPERREDDTPAKYLERLLEVVSRSVVAAALSKSTEPFSQAVLRSYMRGFKFFGDPMDMALRKLLMEAELPKETQQIDRFLQAFANRYHECNPGIYSSPDQAYFVAFSLLILHTDVFNKNNKHKMQKVDYLKNTRGEGIFDEVLEVFYDNITYTPFIHVEDDLDINGDRVNPHKARKKLLFPNGAADPSKRVAKEPVDPYTLIIDSRLDLLRPNLKDVMQLDDPYSYLGTVKTLNMKELQRTFFKTGVLQIVSARSRPDAFMTEKTATNPEEAHPGIVDIKITKVGLLWRKDAKKKKTRSPWQEWGAILTGAQLYFFRNTTWIKHLMHQQKDHLRKGHDGDPCIFKPPLDQFKPDALMSTDGAVALLDSSYNKHKHAFLYVRHGGFEEVLLAEDDEEMNDWLAKLNYAAAFRSSGVRMRGVIGGNYDGQGRRAIRGLEGGNAQVIQTPSGEVTVSRSRIDHKMAQDILAARRDIMFQKIAEANEKLKEAETTLESQLRNSRHLQILAPISPKTREHMLLSAARMAAQLKWSRMEIWRLKCHRDILQMDLDEERQLLGIATETTAESLGKPITREDSRVSQISGAQQAARSPGQPSLTRTSTITATSDADTSPVTESFQTPPTSATTACPSVRENSWEVPGLAFDHGDLRKASVSTAVSSSGPTPITPPRNGAATSASPEKPEFEQPEDEDADERDLLEQAGLLEPEASRSPGRKGSSAGADAEETPERRERGSSSTPADRLERSKIRRSLQRTLRESAGHISHHRHRRGKDSTSNATLSEDANRDAPDVLPRGTGSFVVHGKKASVITFGNELQMQGFSQRMQREDSASSRAGPVAESTDFQSLLTSDREHRGSAASASTATAKSFRELHRKYSSAQAHQRAVHGNLALPSDEDSDAALSFSEGRRTPLPPIDGEEELEKKENLEMIASAQSHNGDTEDESTVEYLDLSPPPSREGRSTVFFTPEPPASPEKETSAEGEAADDEHNTNNRVVDADTKEGDSNERLPSPPLQAVSA
ncbi:Protein transport protein sec73 [Madurella mycetomatis]|uniref:Protein transport protein sec73 n=1 Tax=Madurella mycetomatis TaxID=100816 RepID=A0A175WF88_9PEZI|nr:Protein transport protein sec73 [Madurella mycetomatis]